jgi:release factor glutamine methyltransferase
MNKTIALAISEGTKQLQHCSESAKLDSQLLLAFVLAKPTSYLITWPEKEISAEIFAKFYTLVGRRKNGEPIAYIVGEKEFWSLPLSVSPATLIPRPDTEILVETVLENHPQPLLNCLDLGTGTGAIALALASEQPKWQIDAIDFEPEAVKLALQNQQKLQIKNVHVYQSNWFSNVPADKKYEVIVSNPPYIDALDHHLTEGDVRFEPSSALVAAQQGLADIQHIINTAKLYLTVQGVLYIEHGYQQADAVQHLLSEAHYQGIKTVQDLAGNDRVTFAHY